jgi:hypothetical protein
VIDVAFVHDEELNFEGLSLRDRGSGDTFEIQRSIEFDEQDVALGMDTYCLVSHEATHYGGIVEWAIDGTSFTVHLSNDAQAELGLPPLLAFSLDSESVAVVRRHLPTLCA